MTDVETLLGDIAAHEAATSATFADLLVDRLQTRPIPFFGDIRRATVLTVGVNPSSRELSVHRRKLVYDHALPEKPFGEFMRQVNMLKRRRFGSPEGRVAGLFLRAFVGRQRLLAESKVKYDALGQLAPAVHAAARTIVFTQTKEGARSAARVLRAQGLRVGVVHADVPRRDRHSILKAFQPGDHQVIVAPRVLDEGIDVPAADSGSS